MKTKMKKFRFGIVALAMIVTSFFVGSLYVSEDAVPLSDLVGKAKIEISAIASAVAKLEVKEHMKLDNAEYQSAVITNSCFESGVYYVSIGALAIGILMFLRKLFKQARQMNFKTILNYTIIAGAFAYAIVFNDMYAGIGAAAGLGVVLTPEEEAAQKELMTKIETQTKGQIEDFKKEFGDLATKAKAGIISKEDFDKGIKDLNEKLKSFDPDKFKEYQEKLDKAQAKLEAQEVALTTQSNELKKLKDGGIGGEAKTTLKAELKKILASDEFKAFADSGGKKKAEFTVKAVSVTSDYTGTSRVHITTRDSRVVDHPQVVRMNIRDLLTVSPTDLPYLAFIEVYDWVRAVRPHSENESLAESSFKVREATTDVKRIGTSLPISKRMLRSAAYLESHLASRLPAQVRYLEDFQLLYGDGAGNNLTGIFKVAPDFATVINTSLTGIAGDVASIATYDGGTKTLVNFTANQNINNGDTITFANADVVQYNDSFTALVVGPRQIAIEIAYSAEADVSDWTFVVNSKFKEAIESAQQIDVLKVAKTLVTRQEYACTGIVLHPDDATLIETLKGNDEHYIDVQRLENGIMTIAGVPVVETTAMPSGKFAVGDWTLAAALLEFTPLILEFSESTNEKLTNTVMAIVSEEILFPIYNRYMFITGDFVTAKEAILLPTS